LGHPLTFGYQHQMHRLLKLILLHACQARGYECQRLLFDELTKP
jgi:hypothetical protein